ncbi:MAG: phage tail sheath subtilisin-like domain-containing protein [Rhodospirillaceae bacterium]|nr:phage tail sheath subtilisin-like domain-containing protein [Rhodospirillaceae bacterium]
MTAQIDLHGAEVLYLPDQTAPITVGPSSIVGLVGAAADAANATSARLAVGMANAALTFTAAAAGAAGNTITLEIARPNEASQALSVTVDGRAITVSLATDATGEATTTGVELLAAWALVPAAVALAAIAHTAGSTGADAVSPFALTPLAGGADEPFPLNEPTVVLNAAMAARLGNAGSLPAAIADVWRTAGRAGATIVVVRTDDDMAANVIGTQAAGTGIYALLKAEAVTGLKPRLIAAPALQTTAAALALEAVADRLRAVAVVNLEGATYAAAFAAKSSLAHAYPVWPRFRVFVAASGAVVARSNAALTIGHIARIDNEEGFAASPSNRRLLDVAGTEVPVDWQIDDRNSTANLLSRAFIATAIRRGDGLYLWGNRLADGELITHRRVRHLIGDALLNFIVDYIDRNVDVPFVEHVLDRMNSFLRTQTLAGILTGGRAWFDEAYNTADTLAANRVTFSFDLGLHAVAEQLTFRQSVSGVYNERIIAQLTGA